MYIFTMKVPIPREQYVKEVRVLDSQVDIEFGKRKKVALVFISLNDRYWPYLGQVLQDCRKNFLPQHHVDYFAWTDYNDESKSKQLFYIDGIIANYQANQTQENLNAIINVFASVTRLFSAFQSKEIQTALEALHSRSVFFEVNGGNFIVKSPRALIPEDITLIGQHTRNILVASQNNMDEALKGVTIVETGGIEWPAPTLMRYHLFLQQEEKLKEYDYIFYMDADMRVVATIGDEILSEDLTVALHPMYDLNPTFIPPYEPNKESKAFIPRLGHIVDHTKWEKGVVESGTPEEILAKGGKPRFRPLYLAGGFQGGTSKKFLEAMHTIVKGIDSDFDKGYTAIWNDESHWNEYMFEHYGPILGNNITVLGPEYIYPDSLIKEYYEPRWGRSIQPKIVTLTKPFSLSSQAGSELNKLMKV